MDIQLRLEMIYPEQIMHTREQNICTSGIKHYRHITKFQKNIHVEQILHNRRSIVLLYG